LFVFTLIVLIVAIVAVVRSTSVSNELRGVRFEIDALRGELQRLAAREVSPGEPIASPKPEPAAQPQAEWFTTQRIETPLPRLEPEAAPAPAPAFEVSSADEAVEPPPPVRKPVFEPPPLDEPAAAAFEASPESAAPPQPAAASAEQTVAPPRQRIDWESFVGVKLFSWIAGIAITLAVVFFLKDAVERGLITPPVRLAIGVAFGIALLIVSELKAAGRYRVTANAMDGAGLAILYASLFAAHQLWHLIPAIASFVAMIAVTAVAVWLSTRRDSPFIALLGLLGGFATPALLSTGQDRPVGLFSYLLVLNVGLAWVSVRRNWPALTLLTVIFTALYQWGWVVKFLGASKLPIGFAVFLIFPLVAVFAFVLKRKPGTIDGKINAANVVSLGMPLLFALYVASNPPLAQNFNLLFGFLFCVAAGLAAVAALRERSAFLHPMGAVATVLVFIVWMSQNYSPAAWPKIALWATLFAAVYHFAPLVAKMAGYPYSRSIAVGTAVAGSILLFVFAVLAGVEPASGASTLYFALLLLIGLTAAASSFSLSHWNPFGMAAAGIAIALAVWCFRFDDVAHLGTMIAVLLIFALFFPAVSWVGVRFKALSPRPAYAMLACSFLAFYAVGEYEELIGAPQFAVLLGGIFVIAAVAALTLSIPRLLIATVAATHVTAWLWSGVGKASGDALVAHVLVAAATVAVMLYDERRARREETAPNGLLPAGAAVSAIFGMIGVMIASQSSHVPSLFALAIADLILIAFLFFATRRHDWHALEILAIVPLTVTYAAPNDASGAAAGDWRRLFFAASLYLPFVLHPLTLGEKAVKRREPYLVAALAGLPFLVYGRSWFIAAGLESIIGILPVAQAALMGLLVLQLLRLEPAGERNRGRLALTAGVALAFVTAAIPLQLDKEWITLAWALEVAALAWLHRRVPHNGLLVAMAGLGAVVFARLALNPAVLEYHPRQGTPILNWYLYTYLVASAAFLAGAQLLADREKPLRSALRGGATILLFLLLNIEIADFYSTGHSLTFNFSGSLAQELTYTIAWGVFALALLVTGIVVGHRSARIASIALLVVTIFKCFLHDLGRLGGLYRVGAFIGLAICLSLVALLLQRFVLGKATPPPAGVAPQP
jgi:uncharacterized membrane protein